MHAKVECVDMARYKRELLLFGESHEGVYRATLRVFMISS